MKEIFNFIATYISENWWIISKKLLLAVWIFMLVYIVSNFIIKRVQNKIEANNIQSDDKYSKKLSALIWRILSLVALIINILIIFEVLWIDVSLIMAWISLWIWFAIETMIWNIVAWFFIILNKKFKIWDSVELLGRFNTKGVIEEINLKHTIIRLIDKRRLLIPNKIMADTAIKTNKSEKVVRWDFSISVPRHVNVDQVKNIIKDTVNSNENVLDKDYTTTYIKWFDSKWYNFNTIFFVDPSQVSPFIAWTKIRKSLFDNFKKYWINFTYEHMTIDFE